MDLLNIPEPILIKICEYSALKELKNLMLSCQYFNELVCNTKKLMAKFTFTWRKDRAHLMLRNYQSLSMSLPFCIVFDTSVANFLKNRPSLKFLKLSCNIAHCFFSDDIAGISGINLEGLKLSVHALTQNTAKNINVFLKSQSKSLKSLELVVYDHNDLLASIFKDVYIESIIFKYNALEFSMSVFLEGFDNLTHLVIDTKDTPTARNAVGQRYFKNIKELTLIDVQIDQMLLDALKKLPTLKKVNFKNTSPKDFVTLPHVTEMTFHNQKFEHVTFFLNANRQVVTLKVSGDELVPAGYLMIILRTFKNLKHIDLSDVQMDWHGNPLYSHTVDLYGGHLLSLRIPRPIV